MPPPPEASRGSDFEGGVNAKVEKHLQRNCESIMDQISWLSIRDEKFGEATGAGTGGDQQSEPLKVDDVKAGAKEITGSAFLLPGEMKTVQLTFPNFRVLTEKVELKGNSGEADNIPEGKRVPFKFKVPDNVTLKEGDRLLFRLQDDSQRPGAGENKSIAVYVKPADNGNGQAPGGGAGEKPGKPHVPGEKPGKPSVPGAGDKPGTGGGSSSFGSS